MYSAVSLFIQHFMLYEAGFLLVNGSVHRSIKKTQVLMPVATQIRRPAHHILGSIVVSIPACHAGDRGSIPRRGGFF